MMKNIHDGMYRADFGVTARGALLVITRPKGSGAYLEGDKAAEWAEHIRTALDKSEANALCHAILGD